MKVHAFPVDMVAPVTIREFSATICVEAVGSDHVECGYYDDTTAGLDGNARLAAFWYLTPGETRRLYAQLGRALDELIAGLADGQVA